jgi:hypothetical protein
MKLFHVLTAVAVSALVSSAALAGSKTTTTTSFGVGGGVFIGGNTGKWATGSASASGQADVLTNGGDSAVLNQSSTGTANGFAVGSTGYASTDSSTSPSVTAFGKGGVSQSTNVIETSNVSGDLNSSTTAANASGTGHGIGGALIVGGGADSITTTSTGSRW